jgi:hypothetical protein
VGGGAFPTGPVGNETYSDSSFFHARPGRRCPEREEGSHPPGLLIVRRLSEDVLLAMSKRLFDPARPLSGVIGPAHDRIKRAVAEAAESDVLAANPDEWGRRLADSELLEPPAVDVGRVEYRDLGPVQVDATNMPGVSYTLAEYGRPIIRDGRRFMVRVPVTGRAELLGYSNRATQNSPLGGEVEGQYVVATEDWPLVKGSTDLEVAFGEYLARLRDSSESLATDVRRFNDELPGVASQATSCVSRSRPARTPHRPSLRHPSK